jgi:hypothetical protein
MKAMLCERRPALTELEDVVLDWLRQMMGLPIILKELFTTQLRFQLCTQ